MRPTRTTALVGREEQLTALAALLDRSPVLTLTGAGGCGKTRLAAELLPDDVAWVDLAPVTDPALVPLAVGDALGLAGRPGVDALTWLVDGAQPTTLVLDNCEHLVGACAELVAALVPAGVRVVATSREPLGVEGEVTYRVPSLATEAAQELFLDRARLVRPDLVVGADDEQAVQEICVHLDGIPLALELAAARTRMMTPRQIADGLGDRFHLLTGGHRGALPRQRTLEASVAWSYALLTDDESALLRRLAVFPSTFDLAAVTALGGTVDLLAALIDKSLVQVSTEGEAARYWLLETVRAFAQQRLLDDDGSREARDLHLAHFLAVAEAAELGLFAADVVPLLDALDRDLPDLRAAMDWAEGSRRPEEALRIAGSLWLYWFIRTRHVEGARRLAGLLEKTPSAPPLLRYRALNAALMLCLSSDWRTGLAYAREIADVAGDLGDDGLLSHALAWRGQALEMTGDGDGLPDLRAALEVARRSGNDIVVARALQWLGTILVTHGEAEEGGALLDDAISLSRAGSNVLQLGWALSWRAISHRTRGDLDLAEKAAAEAYDVLTARGEEGFAALPLAELAMVELARGRLAEGQALVGRALACSERSAAPLFHAHAAMTAGLAHIAAGELDAGDAQLALSFDLYDRGGFVTSSGLSLALRGLVAAAQGRLEEAEPMTREAVRRSDRIVYNRVRALAALSTVRRLRGDLVEAREHAHEALRLAASSQDRFGQVDALEVLSAVLHQAGDTVEAARLLAAAAAGAERLGYVRPLVFAGPHEDLVAKVRDDQPPGLGRGQRAVVGGGGRLRRPRPRRTGTTEHRVGQPDAHRVRGRPAGRPGPVEPGRRGAAVRHPQHRQDAPGAGLPQARGEQPQRAHRRGRPTGGRISPRWVRLPGAGFVRMNLVSPQSQRVLVLLRAMPQLAAVPTQDLHQLAMQASDVTVEGGKALPASRQTLVVTGLVEVTQDGRRVAVAGPGQVLPSGPATALVPTRALTFREEQDLLSPGRR